MPTTVSKWRNIKAIATDLDGTVLDSHAQLGERTLTAFRLCRERGLQLIICTGRSAGSASPYQEQLGNDGPNVFFNGSLVVNMHKGKIIPPPLGAFYADPELIDFCADLGRESGAYCQAYFHTAEGEEILVAERRDRETGVYANRTRVPTHIGDLKAFVRSIDTPGGIRGCIKGMFIADGDILDMLRQRISEAFGQRAYITRSSPVFLEVTNAGINKATGLELALTGLGIKAGEVLALGDEENDLPMLRLAGISAAPSNAKDTVKAEVDYVYGSCDEEGAAAFLENQLLKSL
jgi:Cof subfamily protein (haloacid dehalogenase superfamily)